MGYERKKVWDIQIFFFFYKKAWFIPLSLDYDLNIHTFEFTFYLFPQKKYGY